jgi:hypothetical protein
MQNLAFGYTGGPQSAIEIAPSAEAQRFNESQRHDLTSEDARFTAKSATLCAFVIKRCGSDRWPRIPLSG